MTAKDPADAVREALLPCPFCGSDDLTNDGGFVYCESCYAQGPVYQYGLAAKYWNIRHTAMQEPQP